ncbi:MAG TPA: hypothetical protein VEB19_11110 [Gemmatimonadaceae bacterium]|nr:hypothetical protein [Gemmatimonadaceae bacterium]
MYRTNISILTIALLVTVGACRDSAPVSAVAAPLHAGPSAPVGPVSLSSAELKDVASLRRLTARFHTFDNAVAAGWTAKITECFEDATLGGMGYHYGNPALIDGTVNVLEPELLLYEPQKNGKLRFVAVEYIVPFDAWTASEPPKLYGQSFHRNEAFGIWALHVWHERENPRGMFADWNPKVNCSNAQ